MISESAHILLSQLQENGIELAIDPEHPGMLRYRPKSIMTPALAKQVIDNKSDILRILQPGLPADINLWPEDWREEYEERAAIMDKDFYGSLSRAEAEQWAETIVRAFYQCFISKT